ncbi:alpha/beta hydrolase [Urbifossiella limnaea]|uniref:Alpha/beta hydrolase family protein n=1 Tax=Urbifossiella limnaea TaxID=2528023 RepID=A0A517XNP3_9BACT|nr:acetylxylan esterase [Urbifossiella limnaea]QDU19128.1 Alpha/beta hydrolase family protein [Urbifossiella limnaea]
MRTLLAVAALALVAADLPDVDPAVFPPDDPRAKALSKMVWADARKRLADAGEREANAFAAVRSRADWEAFRNPRLVALKASLGHWPEPPARVRVEVLKSIPGDGFVIDNLVYESRPGLWVTANRYRPATPAAKMPGFLLSHSHHTGRTQGELQDMGMTWARAGGVVLVPDHLGHGERRQHPFRTEKDFPQQFKAGRQDYYHRYVTNLQLSAVGDSLMGWMAWDLMRGVDVLLQHSGADPERIIILGAVAGGGDPAGVTAALDRRISCVVPFNFGGWQPESSVTANPDREFAWFGDGYWESTRGLRNGARDGFAHWVIVGCVAPRPVVYAHEFAWNPATDPAWPRLQKVFGFYAAVDKLGFAHGGGSVKGQPPESTHCTHIGAVHRKMVYPYLAKWFGMPSPAEYSKRLPSDQLACWTDPAEALWLRPRELGLVLQEIGVEQQAAVRLRLDAVRPAERPAVLRKEWAARLGDVDPRPAPAVFAGRSEPIPGGTLARFALETEPGITVPLLLLKPTVPGPRPVVVMVSQPGRAGFLKQRGEAIDAFLKAGVAVCLPDVRGTGETQPGTSPERSGSRTSLSQTEQILGRTVLGNQLRDLRTVLGWLHKQPGGDAGRVVVWGESFVEPFVNVGPPRVPLDLTQPRHAEPGAPTLALLAGLFEESVAGVVARRGLQGYMELDKPYVLLPHDAVVPGGVAAGDLGLLAGPRVVASEPVNGTNEVSRFRPRRPVADDVAAALVWVEGR